MIDTGDPLLQIALHESGHVLGHWHYSDEVLAVTLAGLDGLGGSIWARGCSDTVVGCRQKMTVLAAGAAATGEPLAGDDLERVTSAARRIVGLTGTPEQLQEEIARAQVAASWLCKQYKGEIEVVAAALVGFHELLGGFERRRHDL